MPISTYSEKFFPQFVTRAKEDATIKKNSLSALKGQSHEKVGEIINDRLGQN
jgi:predicted lactoylglutathione lyase